MTDEELREAVALAGAPRFRERPDDDAWKKVEAELGVKFPATHKQFVSTFGTGLFGVDLYVLNPSASEPNIRLGRKWLERSRLRERVKSLPIPYFDGGSGLLPVASTTSQIDFGYLVENGIVEDRIIVIDLGLAELIETNHSLCQFILRVFRPREEWVWELRDCLWNGPETPFFQVG